MPISRFLVTVLLISSSICGGFAYMNYRLDPLGVFGQPREGGIPLYYDERFCKYMLSLRYIPENYDEVLIGGSNSDNFPVALTSDSSRRMYNASISAGNVCELLPLVERVTRQGRVKRVFFCVDPYHTKDANFKTDVRMESVAREAWGSIRLFKLYANIRGGLSGKPYLFNDADGVLNTEGMPESENWFDENPHLLKRELFPFDPAAGEQLRELAELCRARQVELIPFLYVRPTVYYEQRGDALHAYAEKVGNCLGLEVFEPNLCEAPEIQRLLDDHSTFRDGIHLSKKGAAELWPLLYRWVLQKRGALS